MKATIVSDTSSLIILAKIERLVLLEHLFEKVFIPKSVAGELAKKEDGIHQTITNSPLYEVVECENPELLALLDELLDKGEAEALALAKEKHLILLIDEKKGRKIARKMHIEILGFLGILLLNYRHKHLNKADIKDIIHQAEQLDFRLSERLKHDFFTKL